MERTKLGLPFGVSLILIAVADIVILSYDIYMESIHLYLFYWNWSALDLIMIPPLQLLVDLTCLWIGTIFLGRICTLIVWICTTSVTVASILGLYIARLLQYNEPFRIFGLYFAVIYILWYIYIIITAIQILSYLRKNQVEEIQPVGKGFVGIWKYFTGNTVITARFLLSVELIVNSYFFVMRKFSVVIFHNLHYGHEDDDNIVLSTEEYCMRGFQLFMALAGIYFIQKSKQQWMKVWCGVSAAMWSFSLGIYFYLVGEWFADNEYFTYGYLSFLFPISLGFRFIVLLACFVYSTSTLSVNDSTNMFMIFSGVTYQNLLKSQSLSS